MCLTLPDMKTNALLQVTGCRVPFNYSVVSKAKCRNSLSPLSITLMEYAEMERTALNYCDCMCVNTKLHSNQGYKDCALSLQ